MLLHKGRRRRRLAARPRGGDLFVRKKRIAGNCHAQPDEPPSRSPSTCRWAACRARWPRSASARSAAWAAPRGEDAYDEWRAPVVHLGTRLRTVQCRPCPARSCCSTSGARHQVGDLARSPPSRRSRLTSTLRGDAPQLFTFIVAAPRRRVGFSYCCAAASCRPVSPSPPVAGVGPCRCRCCSASSTTVASSWRLEPAAATFALHQAREPSRPQLQVTPAHPAPPWSLAAVAGGGVEHAQWRRGRGGRVGPAPRRPWPSPRGEGGRTRGKRIYSFPGYRVSQARGEPPRAAPHILLRQASLLCASVLESDAGQTVRQSVLWGTHGAREGRPLLRALSSASIARAVSASLRSPLSTARLLDTERGDERRAAGA